MRVCVWYDGRTATPGTPRSSAQPREAADVHVVAPELFRSRRQRKALAAIACTHVERAAAAAAAAVEAGLDDRLRARVLHLELALTPAGQRPHAAPRPAANQGESSRRTDARRRPLRHHSCRRERLLDRTDRDVVAHA